MKNILLLVGFAFALIFATGCASSGKKDCCKDGKECAVEDKKVEAATTTTTTTTQAPAKKKSKK